MGHVEIAKMLLDSRDCNPNAIDDHGRTGLFKSDSGRAVRNHRRTPLRVALADSAKESTRAGRLEIAELLKDGNFWV